MRAWEYTPPAERVRGAYLLVPGLHFLGPEDPRLDRFARIIAGAGFVVLAPFLPDFLALQVKTSVVADTARALEHLLESHERPAIFSISFGSLPALRVAAAPEYAERIGAVIVFGGYAEFDEVLRYVLAGPAERDPLNQPVVLMNLVEHLEGSPADPAALMGAWHAYVRATWGRPEMKARERWAPVAEEIAVSLADDVARRLFRAGVGLDPGALALCEDALRRAPHIRVDLDPRPHLAGLRAPVHLIHGAADDVIPAAQLELLRAAMPPGVSVKTYLTGLYAHTGHAGPSLGALYRELRTMLAMLEAIATAPGRRR